VKISVGIVCLMSKIHESVCPVSGVIETVELPMEHSDALLWTIHGHYVAVTCEDCKADSSVRLMELMHSLRERGIVPQSGGRPRYPKLLEKHNDHAFWGNFG
jgi:hypothetical protein